jgi:hypothetical protein
MPSRLWIAPQRTASDWSRISRTANPCRARGFPSIYLPKSTNRNVEELADEVFDAYRRNYDYDPTASFDARKEGEEDAKYWVREKISFAAAYGDERMTLYLYLPRDQESPYQTGVFFPGAGAVHFGSVDQWRTIFFDFIIRYGRALAFAVYKGTFERKTELTSTDSREDYLYRDHVILLSAE